MTTIDFSLKLLGKSLTQITAKDLTEYFQIKREESDILEFKSFYRYSGNNKDFQKREDVILKTICAFLNSSGGLLIWGAPVEEKVSNNQTSSKRELTPIEKYIEKDSFIGKISNRIVPVPPNVNFHPVEVEKDKFVYLIEVQQSITKPHQFDNRYFMRLDGQTKFAPHHYVEALFKQIKYPNLGGKVKLSNITVSEDKTEYYCTLVVAIYNNSSLQNAENVSFMLSSDKGKIENKIKNNQVSYAYNDTLMTFEKFVDVLFYGNPCYHLVQILFRVDDFINSEHEVNIELGFGSKKSPLKFSKYKFRLDKFSEKENSYILLEKENKFVYEMTKGEQGEILDNILDQDFWNKIS